MIKKGSLLLVALLFSLPSCMEKKDKKASRPKKDREVAQVATDRASDELKLAGADSNAEVESFFNELGEFDLAADETGEKGREGELAWAGDTEKTGDLDTIHFAFDRSDVTVTEDLKVKSAADKAKQLLAEAQADGFNAKLVVEGYACKSAGSAKYNQKLSEKRAQRVAQQLVASGVREEDIEARGLGSTNLIVKEGSRDAQQPNRRVELHVIYS